jgi:hypothetical protein
VQIAIHVRVAFSISRYFSGTTELAAQLIARLRRDFCESAISFAKTLGYE